MKIQRMTLHEWDEIVQGRLRETHYQSACDDNAHVSKIMLHVWYFQGENSAKLFTSVTNDGYDTPFCVIVMPESHLKLKMSEGLRVCRDGNLQV